MLPLILRTRGAPCGEPVAEDFDFLHRALLEPARTLLDGGGSMAFWRPVSHQLYYQSLGSLMLGHPGAVAAIHVVLLSIAALLLYRGLRRHASGPAAAAVASFPLLAESTRTLVCWPSHFVDLGAFFFLAVAWHEALHDRARTALPAMLAALLCKELALVGALLLPFAPGVGARSPRGRVRWLMGTGAVIVVWAAGYAWVRSHAGLEMPHGLERNPGLLTVSLHVRLGWAIGNCLRASFSLARMPSPLDLGAAAALLAIAGTSLGIFARQAAARARWRRARPWVVWGALWAALSWAAIASIFPLWAPNRSQLGSVGFCVAAVAATAAAHPALAGALVALRLGLLALAPATPARITPDVEDRGTFMDYPRLCRLQRLMREARTRLRARYPTLPHGATVGWDNLPHLTEYAFGGDHALQAWYRDGSLHWVGSDVAESDATTSAVVYIGYQSEHDPQVVLLDPAAVGARRTGVRDLVEGRWPEAIAAFDEADSLQRDRQAFVFLGDLAGRRAYCRAQLGDWTAAERDARRALGAAAQDVGARYVLALARAARRDDRAAYAQLDTLLATAPDHQEGRELMRFLRAHRGRPHG